MSIKSKIEGVKKNIQKWLSEEGFKVQPQSDKNASFNILAEDQAGITVNVLQPINKINAISIVTNATLTRELQIKLVNMDMPDRERVLWTLRFGLLNKGVGFSAITMPLQSITLSRLVYYDGLTKDNFMNKLFEVRKALVFVFWIIDRELGEPEPTVKLPYIQ